MSQQKFYNLLEKLNPTLAKKNLSQKEEFLGDIKEKHIKLINDLGYRNNVVMDQAPELFPASVSVYPSYVLKTYCDQFDIDFAKFYSFNSDKLRSDEFTKEHNGKHVLFAGCSVSFGDSLPLEYSWTKKTYDAIAKQEKVSGYFNVSRPGASTNTILVQVFKYIEKYGLPDVVFLNLPDTEREFAHDEEDGRIHIIAIGMYRFLNWVMKANGKRLITFSWDARANLDYSGSKAMNKSDPRPWLENFYQFSVKDREEHVFDTYQANKSSPDIIKREFSVVAMDDTHPGIGEHDFYYKFAMDIYNERVEPSSPETLLSRFYRTGKYD